MTLRFGTDGVRGSANAELTPEMVLALGRAAASVLGGPRFLVGRDTRRSGPLLCSALAAGLMSEGVDVVDLGVIPTPGVAARSADTGMPAAVVSASHNPFADNGVKLFGGGGRKLADAEEESIERWLAELLAGPDREKCSAPGPVALAPEVQGARAGGLRPGRPAAVVGSAVGSAVVDSEALEWYRQRLVGSLQGRRLSELAVALDCANGAAAAVAPEVFAASGARVVATVGTSPEGTNINDRCGSTDPSALVSAVLSTGADLGLAFDGDADRVIAVDGCGRVVDGDRLLALFALDLRSRGLLAGDTVVVTVMTNLGFHRAMGAAGIGVHTTDVGDRNVLAALDANGWSLGGEQSGHLVFKDLATTGDGVLSGLLLADLLVRAARPLAGIAEDVMVSFPQVLRNVEAPDRSRLVGAPGLWAEVAAIEADLGGQGRVLVRPSGTEPLVRVMVEASTVGAATDAAERIEVAVRRALSLG
ncbi:MAG: phosphoglucosamine mutase [Actinomycetota bacterium]|nr:phosphoglucosamine mutase [Actinomycetota bacterium]